LRKSELLQSLYFFIKFLLLNLCSQGNFN
jgi:hypothetical protein